MRDRGQHHAARDGAGGGGHARRLQAAHRARRRRRLGRPHAHAAVATRTDPDFIIVARTNARRLYGLDEAMRRGEAFKKAGADMVFVFTRNADEMRTVAERVAPPLMTFAPADGFAEFPLKERDLAGLGYRLAASSGTAFAAMVKAVRQSYQCLAQGTIDPFIGKGNVEKEMKAAAATAGLEGLLEIERRTMKD
jgi:2-methylisocitrate lyase-like PEP mutase family enzyme